MHARIIFFMVLIVLATVGIANAQTPGVTLNLQVTGADYQPGQQVEGIVTITHDIILDKNSILKAYIGNVLKSTVALDADLHDETYYQYKSENFGYKIKGQGENTWVEYPDQTTTFSIRADGTCSGSGCPSCGNPICPWTATFSQNDPVTVNANPDDENSGLKFVLDAGTYNIPTGNNGDTVWTIASKTAPTVDMAILAACGDDAYAGSQTDKNGWVYLPLTPGTWEASGSFGKKTNLEPFDDTSLQGTGRSRYNNDEEIGGIFRNGNYLNIGSDVVVNGPAGYIEIKNYIAGSVYEIYFLPPVGSKVCAYTKYKIPHTETWEKTGNEIQGSANYNSPYSVKHEAGELPPIDICPDDPPFVCTQVGAPEYRAEKTSGGSVDFGYTYNASDPSVTVTATTTSKEFSRSYNVPVSLTRFANLKTPSSGDHQLTIELVDPAGTVIETDTKTFGTCTDADGDGFCQDLDCNDNNVNINPDGQELCNGVDDDCDGEPDEDFREPGSNIGNQCGVGACEGVYVCSSNGAAVVCNNTLRPGVNPEVCANDIDDNCDGQIDEVVSNGLPACNCKDNETKPCGNNIGACEAGVQICLNGSWSECSATTEPRDETCNGVDDNCDGVTDNVGGGSSAVATYCGCFDDALPASEACNDIDDDCNGRVDEGLHCCISGDTRACGSHVGACEEGTETCVNGAWGSCAGGISATSELCYNNLDDNCNGQRDEGCKPAENTCINGKWDSNEDDVDCGGICPLDCEPKEYWFLLIMAGVAIFVVLIILVGYFKSQGKELTWSEVRSKWTPADR
ncbi:MAG: putative metal-binding motif-containing protein [Candidatus Aenigmatarchaeota archaeon]